MAPKSRASTYKDNNFQSSDKKNTYIVQTENSNRTSHIANAMSIESSVDATPYKKSGIRNDEQRWKLSRESSIQHLANFPIES